MKKSFIFTYVERIQINKDFLPILKESSFISKISCLEELNKNFNLTFAHQKHYRVVRAYRIGSKEIYLKKYFKNFREAVDEWKNIQILWQMGFPTSIPVLFLKEKTFTLIGTEKIPGKNFLEIMEKEPDKVIFVLNLIAKYMGIFHQKGLFHQDCYLNHFYLDQDQTLYLIDVSRVLFNPLFSLYYQIKDLAQLRYSFYNYFGQEGLELWKSFLEVYQDSSKKKLNSLILYLIDLKFKKIEKHTKRRQGIA